MPFDGATICQAPNEFNDGGLLQSRSQADSAADTLVMLSTMVRIVA